MSLPSQNLTPGADDQVSNVLKWVLLAVAVLSFGLFFWATARTYEKTPPQPTRYVSTDGHTMMTNTDIVAGKAGFQRADLMDYGSIYGMGSYFGQDYTAFALVRLAKLTESGIAQGQFGKSFGALSAGDQASVQQTMQRDLQGIDLTKI